MSVVIDDGTVTVTVGGESYDLAPTLNAVRGVCRGFGGILTAIQRVKSGDLEAMAAVIAAGSGTKAKADDLLEAVWQHEYKAEIGVSLIEYLELLWTGGKSPELEQANKPGKP